ncbi:MAG: hypothetical protein ACI3Y2_04740 [Candidatus Egerieousia sp.]
MKLTNETIKRLIVAPETLGKIKRMSIVYPYFQYADNQRTDKLLGYVYVVTASGFQGERVGVKIPGKQLLGEEAFDHLVEFTGLRLSIYPTYNRGQSGIAAINLKAEATGISVVD